MPFMNLLSTSLGVMQSGVLPLRLGYKYFRYGGTSSSLSSGEIRTPGDDRP